MTNVRVMLQKKQLEQEKLSCGEEEDGEEMEQDQVTTTTVLQEKPFPRSRNLEDLDPSEIPEFRPMKSVNVDADTPLASGQQSPFYPPGYYAEAGYPSYPQQQAPARPNLYLYSPSNNTLIPCEEIVIPNPVMSGDGPVYPGPTNIYLAYPVSGPDGRGYITQPFSPPLPNDYVPYPNYSPSISVDGSQYHSSTPQTPNSGQESGSSTQPTSPPPLVNYHPANWFEREPRTPDFLQHRTEPLDKIALEPESPKDTPTMQYIPGLPPTANSPKKSQKKKKKKKLTVADHRDSLSSESELTRFYGAVEAAAPLETSNSVLEVNLTDDLADFMVNPPTDPECSDEETLRNSQEQLIREEAKKYIEQYRWVGKWYNFIWPKKRGKPSNYNI